MSANVSDLVTHVLKIEHGWNGAMVTPEAR